MLPEKPYIEDTIVACATSGGVGGINVIRVSGIDAEKIAKKIIGDLPKPRIATYRKFRNKKNEIIDMGLIIFFPSPNSFTGESVVEFHSHGGLLLGELLIDEIVGLGARRAEPGEFSKRAFLNNKIDLIQAEAIADLISCVTPKSARAAVQSLSGTFSELIFELNTKLMNLRLFVEAAIDFPEEEIDFLSDQELMNNIELCQELFKSTLDGAISGEILRNGVQVAIVGPPNAGKSSLFNHLAKSDKAIVTDIPGTTRDILKISVDIDGLQVIFYDTAGIRDNPDEIEAEGIKRTKKLLETMDIAILMNDITIDPSENIAILPSELACLHVNNKIDLINNKSEISDEDGKINISVKSNVGIDELLLRIKKLSNYEFSGDGVFSARTRHIRALERSYDHFLLGKKHLLAHKAGELLAEELRIGNEALGEITGKLSSDELLGKIFSEFCIGK